MDRWIKPTVGVIDWLLMYIVEFRTCDPPCTIEGPNHFLHERGEAQCLMNPYSCILELGMQMDKRVVDALTFGVEIETHRRSHR